jgi:hypothetical protein
MGGIAAGSDIRHWAKIEAYRQNPEFRYPNDPDFSVPMGRLQPGEHPGAVMSDSGTDHQALIFFYFGRGFACP